MAMRVAEGHNKMLSNVAERVTVPRNFIRGALLEQAGQDIQNKLEGEAGAGLGPAGLGLEHLGTWGPAISNE